MKTITRWIAKLLLLAFLVAAIAVVWHEYPRKTAPTGPQVLVLDLAAPGSMDAPGPGVWSTSGRLIHHQQCAPGLADMSRETSGNDVVASRIVPVTFPEGAALTFDLFVPPPLLMDPKAAIQFTVDAKEQGGKPTRVFTTTYRQDWIGFALNYLREKWQVDYGFIDRFRHVTVDLTDFANQAGTLTFRAEGSVAISDEALARYTKWSGATFFDGLTFLSPRLWGRRAEAATDFNVVLCMIDGIRADALSVYGYDRKTSPNIEQLAQKGVVFEQAYAPSNATRNSITAALTGRYPSLLGLPLRRWDLTQTEKTVFRLLTGGQNDSTPSLPRLLTQRGYATGFVGSNPFILPGNAIGADLGFSHLESLNQKKFDTEAIARRANAFIEKNAERPFFLYLHFNNGHGPLSPPEPYRSQFARSTAQKQSVWPDLYDGEIAYADEKVGELLALLEAKGLADNTLFILTSDHGVTFEKGRPKGHAHSLYDSEVRVPLILSFPGRIPPGQRIAQPASLLDLLPTMLAMRQEAPNASDTARTSLAGQSLVDSFEGKAQTTRDLYLEGAGIFALREANEKIIVKTAPYDKLKGDAPTDKGRLLELYDLAGDPGETDNLAGAQTPSENVLLDRLAALRAALARQRSDQVQRLAQVLGDAAFAIYPERTQEAFELVLAAGGQDRRFNVVVKPQRTLASYLGRDFTEGDLIVADTERTFASFEAICSAGQTKRFAFTPFPADDPFVLELYADGQLLQQLFVGPYALDYGPGPVRFDKPRDLHLMTAETQPAIDPAKDFGAFIWRQKIVKDATTTMGGQVKDALRTWGYVK